MTNSIEYDIIFILLCISVPLNVANAVLAIISLRSNHKKED